MISDSFTYVLLPFKWLSKILCRDVNCLDGICGMTGVENKTGGHQWYRLITPIFLHLGKLAMLVLNPVILVEDTVSMCEMNYLLLPYNISMYGTSTPLYCVLSLCRQSEYTQFAVYYWFLPGTPQLQHSPVAPVCFKSIALILP